MAAKHSVNITISARTHQLSIIFEAYDETTARTDQVRNGSDYCPNNMKGSDIAAMQSRARMVAEMIQFQFIEKEYLAMEKRLP